jgi:hypothetical protein
MVLIPNRTATKNKNVTVRIVVAIVDKNNTPRKQTDAAANGKINYTWEYFIYFLVTVCPFLMTSFRQFKSVIGVSAEIYRSVLNT